MKFSSSLILVSTLSLLLGACGGDGSFASSFDNAQQSYGEAFCQCADLLGSTEEECLEELGDGFTQAQRDCVNDLFDAQSPAVKDVLDCNREAIVDIAACMNDVGACDVEAFEACSQTYAEATADCGELPETIEESISACVD